MRLPSIERARRLATTLAASLPLLLTACGGGTATEAPGEPLVRTQTAESSLAYYVTLPTMKPVDIPGMTLTLEVTRIEDSRCPAAAQCPAAGTAHVWLQASAPGAAPQMMELKLTTGTSKEPQSVSQYQGHRITLTEVLPFPGEAPPSPAHPQSVIVLLEKLRAGA